VKDRQYDSDAVVTIIYWY